MTNPLNHGSTDPLQRHRHPGHSFQQPIPEYLSSYQQAHHHEGFEGGLTSGGSQGVHHSPSHQHGYASLPVSMEQRRPHLSVVVPHEMTPTITFDYAHPHQHPSQSHSQPGPQQMSPQMYDGSFVDGSSAQSSNVNQQGGAFSGYPGGNEGTQVYLNLPPHEWAAQTSVQQSPTTSTARNATGAAKVPRHQFTACGACRHRRVKCDLRARQEEAEREATQEETQGANSGPIRRRKVSCTNCQERGTNCVDEYAPLKAAKQLRRGKRISEIEMLYGKSATEAALASQGDDTDRSNSPTGRKGERLPELTREFFDSAFFRTFVNQRPLIEPGEFVTRYFSKPIPCAAGMGPEGAILCHTLYAWAVSYGVDERGQLDVPDGGGEPVGPVNLIAVSEPALRRERDRQRRMEKTNRVVRVVLREIDELGLLRRPSIDGVRALLLILPLTEDISSPVERQAMYAAALSQVTILCSSQGVGYDGLPSAQPPSPGKGEEEVQRLVRMRTFSYAFVHESITVGLRGGNLALMDDEDLANLPGAVESQQLQLHFHSSARITHVQIRLAMACRLIHKELTGARARRREMVSVEGVNAAWEALDQLWDEFESIKRDGSLLTAFRPYDEVVRYADCWKAFLLEAHSAIRQALEDRLERAESAASMVKTDSHSRSVSPVAPSKNMALLRQLFDLARSKVDICARQVMTIIRTHAGSPLFEWDASLIRDWIYHAAIQRAGDGASDEELALCLQSLTEFRWGFAKSLDRSQELRKTWFDGRNSNSNDMMGMSDTAGTSAAQSSLSESPFMSPTVETKATAEAPLNVPQRHGSWTSAAPTGRLSPNLSQHAESPVMSSHGQSSPYNVFQGSPAHGGGPLQQQQAQAHLQHQHMHQGSHRAQPQQHAQQPIRSHMHEQHRGHSQLTQQKLHATSQGHGQVANQPTVMQAHIDIEANVNVNLSGLESSPQPGRHHSSSAASAGHFALQPDGTQVWVVFGAMS